MKNEIDLRLCFWGYEDITHEEITQITGLQPYRVYIKGQRKSEKSTALAKQNGWIFKPSMVSNYSSFEDQIKPLLGVLEDKHEVFKNLCRKYYCELSCALYINIDSDESTPSVHLDANCNTVLKDLNIEFDLDIMLLSDK